jgi:hypothetical protein
MKLVMSLVVGLKSAPDIPINQILTHPHLLRVGFLFRQITYTHLYESFQSSMTIPTTDYVWGSKWRAGGYGNAMRPL